MAQAYLRLAYHTLQTKHHNFEVIRRFDLDPALGLLQVVPQELGRVLLNLFSNAFYAVHEKAALLGPVYVPSVRCAPGASAGRWSCTCATMARAFRRR